MIKTILFVTGTRADYGKLKALMKALSNENHIKLHIFVTGMHLFPKYGSTGDEVKKAGFSNVFFFINQKQDDAMDIILANTVCGLSNYVALTRPDMLVIHGDRIEAMAGAIVGAFNNIIVSHIEGGEVSGTIDESIRHAITKLAHIHFVANSEAKKRLIQMGEHESNVHIIGSPDIDLMASKNLPLLEEVKQHYEIDFDRYAIFMYHPVTTNLHKLIDHVRETISALVESGKNYVAIYPNNDPGSNIIVEELELLRGNPRFKIFSSLRFESFLVLLKNSEFIIGNSSAGIREAPFYGIPVINIGNRQNGRHVSETIVNVENKKEEILDAIKNMAEAKCLVSNFFGDGNSSKKFIEIICNPKTWEVNIQKKFMDISKDYASGQDSISST